MSDKCMFNRERECFHSCPKCCNKITLISGYKSKSLNAFIKKDEAYQYAIEHIETIPQQDLIDFFFDGGDWYETEEEV